MEMSLIGEDLLLTKGKTIKNFTSYDAAGFDRGFEIHFTDGSTLQLELYTIPLWSEPRIKITLKEDPEEKRKQNKAYNEYLLHSKMEGR